ncbi:hypothetical protein EY643_04345 [Halioglobus maricola]|uniref:Aminopeptidase n=1 Tax=Halioglobus maricola TaxID=2601894 RepID=A0A5P9NGJ7_9GAMM|nr:PA4642 family protein [Halioglobus maricola]QFU74933.1 hypothetical protein EY643_04345 [Halioglobus maricola]
MKKDKQKVIDDVWTEDHIRSFLDFRPHDGSNEDFHILQKAYQSMRADDFELFVSMFTGQERDVNATGRDGRTVLAIVGEHRKGTPYAEILKAAGAA